MQGMRHGEPKGRWRLWRRVLVLTKTAWGLLGSSFLPFQPTHALFGASFRRQGEAAVVAKVWRRRQAAGGREQRVAGTGQKMDRAQDATLTNRGPR
jgi:hypothetical protein